MFKFVTPGYLGQHLDCAHKLSTQKLSHDRRTMHGLHCGWKSSLQNLWLTPQCLVRKTSCKLSIVSFANLPQSATILVSSNLRILWGVVFLQLNSNIFMIFPIVCSKPYTYSLNHALKFLQSMNIFIRVDLKWAQKPNNLHTLITTYAQLCHCMNSSIRHTFSIAWYQWFFLKAHQQAKDEWLPLHTSNLQAYFSTMYFGFGPHVVQY